MSGSDDVRVSVTIPVFNGMPYIKAAAESAIDQLLETDELVVVDNASTDGTRGYLESITDPRVRVVLRKGTQPVEDNWTQAVLETRGTYVKLMCGDDLIEPGCLRTQVDILNADPDSVMVAGMRVIVDDRDQVLIRRHGLNGLPKRMSGAAALVRCMRAGTNLLGEPAATMFRGDAIREAMPWVGKWPYMLDLATYSKVLQRGDIALIHEPLARFRVSASSASAQMLSDQPKDFRRWRDWQRGQPHTNLGPMGVLQSELTLWARTTGRRLYFKRVARRARREARVGL